MLKEIMPANVRSKVYAAFAVIAVAFGAVQVGFASADVAQPVWLGVFLAVFTFVGGAVGFTAAGNTESSGRHVAGSEDVVPGVESRPGIDLD